MADPITYLDHAVDVLAQVAAYARTGRRFVLATSVDIKGGSARDIGSLAVISEDGFMTGYMSNGCIDRDILLQGLSCLEQGQPKLLRYGAGSPFSDLILPCGGALAVWIDPDPDVPALLTAYEKLRDRRATTLTFEPHGKDYADPLTICYQPKVSLTLAGRGAIFRSTVRIAQASGLEVFAYSPDEADLKAVFPFCIQAPTHMRSQNDIGALKLDAHSAVLTLFHDHDWEPDFLKAALATPARFIGALGSRKTHAARIETLLELGVSPQDAQRVRGPIGLIPSLRDANFIAVSALAEIAQSFAYEQQKQIRPDVKIVRTA
ncbi:MAG: XdhC family protein [Litoreibacter sp.]|uniref:XdhC family protein n=1 Tax=Litoreibacter sp. TaxID=1969459 RepID=UPI0032968F5B